MDLVNGGYKYKHCRLYSFNRKSYVLTSRIHKRCIFNK